MKRDEVRARYKIMGRARRWSHIVEDYCSMCVVMLVALEDPKLRKTYTDGGMDLYSAGQETPEAATALLKSEVKLWGDVIRANHIATQ